MQLVWIGSLFFAMLIALFAIQNTERVTIGFLVWRVEAVATSMVVLGAAALGALTTYLFGLSRAIRGRLERRGSRSTIRGQDALIEELRARVRELEQEAAARQGSGVGSRGAGSGSRESELPARSDPNPSSAPASVVGFPPPDPQAGSEPTDARAGERHPRLPPPAS